MRLHLKRIPFLGDSNLHFTLPELFSILFEGVWAPITFVLSSAVSFAIALIQFLGFLFGVVILIAYVCVCTLAFIFIAALITAWFSISAIALIGMELLCFVSAMTNPEVGLILCANIDERRYKLGAAAGFLEDFPGFILQAYYTHLMGVRGPAGVSRAISLSLSSWRMFVLTVKRFIKFKMMAKDRRDEPEAPSKVWTDEETILKNSHGVVRMILFKFRSSLFPDPFSAFLRIIIFCMYVGTFGWLASQNMFIQSGFSTFLDTNFPVPNVCIQQSAVGFKICDINARCVSGVCICNSGYVGDGQTCILVRSSKCMPNSCAFPATCVDMIGGTHTCPCPEWSVAPQSGSAFMRSSERCSCSSSLFPIPCAEKGGCVSKTNLFQWEVVVIMIGVCLFVILTLFCCGWFWKSEYTRRWKYVFVVICFATFTLSLGLILGLPERLNTISYGDCIYATVADSEIDSKKCFNSHDDVFLPIPCGWKVAEDSTETKKVIREHSWGTEVIIARNTGKGRGRPYFSPCMSLDTDIYMGSKENSDYLKTDERGWVKGFGEVNGRYYRVQVLIVKNLTQLYPPPLPYNNESAATSSPPPPPSSSFLYDDFSSSSLRSDLWHVLSNGGHWGSALQVGGGNLVMTNRPVIRTMARFTSQSFPITISGRFKYSGNDFFLLSREQTGLLQVITRKLQMGCNFGWNSAQKSPFRET
jgi:hypothetical protein